MDLATALNATGATRRGTAVRTGDGYAFDGGLNTEDPPANVQPGHVLGAKNYEPNLRGGYSRAEGYERYDGRTGPTNGEFTILIVNGEALTVTAGQAIVQYATGTSTPVVASGTVAFARENEDVADQWYVTVVNYTGTFDQVGDLYLGANTPPGPDCTSEFAGVGSALEDDLTDEMLYEKTEYLRSLIGAVGGASCSGPVRGIKLYKQTLYAFRDNLAGTAGTMWKESAAGWVSVPLGFKLRFNSNDAEIAEGATITGATSGTTAVVRRYVVTDGDVGTADASGYIIVTGVTGSGFTGTEVLNVAAVNVANFVSYAAQTLPPGGDYFFRVHNFYGAEDRRFMYGVNGVGNGFEFDGTYFTLIETGMVDDRPTRLAVLNDHLLFSYRGGSLQNSGFTNPLSWNPTLGADERSTGSDVTDMMEETNNSVFVGCRQHTYVFYGDTIENFQFKLHSIETGIIPKTIGKLGNTIFLDDRGFTTLKAAQEFGNFTTNSISDKILKLLQSQIRGTTPAGAIISRTKNLYRCFFNDGYAFVVSTRPGNKFSGWMSLQLAHVGTCFDSSEDEEGIVFTERLFMGCEDGYVRELDIGRSFDGQDIEAFLRLAYHHTRSPEHFKRYRRAYIDVDVRSRTTLFGTVDFNYGNREAQVSEQLDFEGGGGFWDVASWDEFLWSGQAFDQVIFKIEGAGFNIGLFFYSKSDRQLSHTLYNCSYQSSQRRLNRGTQQG